jgi:hypothetical protein
VSKCGQKVSHTHSAAIERSHLSIVSSSFHGSVVKRITSNDEIPGSIPGGSNVFVLFIERSSNVR